MSNLYFRKLFSWLSIPKSIASIALFRISFGLIMLWEVSRYFKYGWIKQHFIESKYTFTYDGFSWITPWQGDGMYIHFYVLGILAIFIAIGFLYRISAIFFFIGFTYIFLLDKTHYLNHFYLISLISFVLIIIPAHSYYSVDSILFPKIRRKTIPNLYLLLLKFQIAIPYFFGGIAKLNADWLKGEPMRSWLPVSAEKANLIEDLLIHQHAPMLFSYGGLLFDLLIVPALIFKPTRLLAFTIAILFHLTNAYIFSIGIFPWFMIIATTLFFKPDWCKPILNKIPPFGSIKTKKRKTIHINNYFLLGILIYVIIQIAMPLRHYFISGNVHWTEEGHRYSWHMKLRTKSAINVFFITDETGKKTKVHLDEYLSKRQQLEMGTQPDMMWQFAQFLKEKYATENKKIKVTVASFCSLNGRPNQLFVKSDFDLAGLSKYRYPADWIEPLQLTLINK